DTSPLLQRGYWFYSPTEPSKRWRTRIPASFAAYEASLGKKRRYQFRTAGRKLDEAVGEPVLIERVTKPAEMGAFLKSVERISALSWQGRRLGQVLEVESTGARKLKELAERGWFRGYLLRAEGEAIAFVIGFQSDKRYVYEKIGYDPAWGEHSPGNVLLYRLIEDLCSFEPPEWLDFGFGESQYKRVFGNDWYEEQNVYLIRRSLYTGMARATQRVFRATSDEARRVLDRLGLRERVRRILRGGPEEPTTKRDPV
ncbi:MAG: GNAT family N-acetyltransferase, partial [Myxococcales bacterium]